MCKDCGCSGHHHEHHHEHCHDADHGGLHTHTRPDGSVYTHSHNENTSREIAIGSAVLSANDAVAEEMAIALRELRDPRLTDYFVSITRADVAPDLRVAKIYFSAMGDASAFSEV